MRNIWKHSELIKQLAFRDIATRYKGSYLGVLWSVIIPFLMLTIYTFVFSVVFNARWNSGSTNKIEFALIIFSGMIVYNLFSEVANRSPGLVVGNVNYVKKVVFPLHILPVSVVLSTIINMLISVAILIIGLLIFGFGLHWTALLFPLVLLPLILFVLGLSWILSSLGVYLRDIGHVVGVLTSALMFLSPIFYPVSSIPNEFQFFYKINPISYVVEDTRQILIWGNLPNYQWIAIGTCLGLLFSFIGYKCFEKTRRGFADVL
ncbi:ABC transporter permease [Paenibacillus sp. J31TS4]|uniref:ABC transporter permease n=1 Tax=Paenibacillus sp. J31TS4 TaxID=2807195 RepID=UPI001BCB4D5F|nr:ABC transporter permease [Paenibacillus sp. J31TS4]